MVLIIIFAPAGLLQHPDQRKHLEDAALVSAEQQSEVLRRSASRYMLNNDRIGLYEMMPNMADQPGMCASDHESEGVISYSTATRRGRTHGQQERAKPAKPATSNPSR